MGLIRRLREWREKVDGTLAGPALETDEVNLSNPFVQTGDVVPFVSANGVEKQSVSTSNTSYQDDRKFVAARTSWSRLFNDDQQIAVGASIRVASGPANIRVRNASQEETIVEREGLSGADGGKYFLGFEDYSPPNRQETDIVWIEYQSSDGSGITIEDGLLYIGPRL
jgi:hypothetical protein